ncbi:MAG: UDP-N-acetylglucosamine 2-epimerase (non-hydrolyzing) [Nitrospirae bacterium]|nr:MAG: UDP-N-acetylglucosamine 2-epimerase (non-hydrolyzing) [Nitrospirota bacterium]
MKIATVLGARPQFIKAAAVSRAIREHNLSSDINIDELIIHTGQHFERRMSELFFEEMQIPSPDYHLGINSMDHGAMTGRMLEGIESILLKEKPEYVLVYGDTTSTLAGALAAKKLSIKVAHIEAGLRSFNMMMPEEINRVITDRISDILCCPTQTAVENLKKEGFDNFGCKIFKTGDVMYDSVLFYSEHSSLKSDIMDRTGLSDMDFVLCTVHRAENTDDIGRLYTIVEALGEIASEIEAVFPVHPRTRNILNSSGLIGKLGKVRLIEPVGYFDMIELMKNTRCVLTDSGGLQKEAFFFAKPCIVLRDQTEWIELLDSGSNRLAGAERDVILECYNSFKPLFIGNPSADLKSGPGLYGNGKASYEIVRCLIGSGDSDKTHLESQI